MIIYQKNADGLIEKINVTQDVLEVITEEQFNLRLEEEKQALAKAEEIKQNFIEQTQKKIATLEVAKEEMGLI